ncbi:MAG: hypothetical protein JXQ89_01755 [Pelagimonas sp.]
MKGFLIFKHALTMVLRNWKQAIMLGALPVGIIVAAAVLLLRSHMDSFVATGLNEFEFASKGSGAGAAFFLVWIISVVCMLWVMVNWHRYVILEEYPSGWVPPFHADRVLGYLGRILLLALVMFVVMIPIGIGAAVFAAIAPPLALVFMAVAYIAVIILMYRLVVIMPAAAIGKPIGLRDALEATKGANLDIAVLLVTLFLANFAVQIVGGLIVFLVPVVGIVALAVCGFIFALTGVSVLTTFYGHYIEGRPIG